MMFSPYSYGQEGLKKEEFDKDNVQREKQSEANYRYEAFYVIIKQEFYVDISISDENSNRNPRIDFKIMHRTKQHLLCKNQK